MSIIIYILTLVIVTLSQSCCGDASACPINSACLCQQSVNTCMYQLSEQQTYFTLTSSQINYFYWTPNASKYNTIDVFFCLNSQPNVNFNIGYLIQNSNGQGYPTDLSIAIPSKGNGCWLMPLVNYQFCKLTNGSYCDLIMGVQLNGAQQFTVQIFVNYIEGTGKFLIPVLISVGVLLLIVIIVLVGCIIKKRMENQQRDLQYKIDNDITHFDNFFPKQTLQSILKEQNKIDQIINCAVCILDIQKHQMCRRTNCGHIFHHECIDVWCKKNMNCPMCRQPLDLENLKIEEQQNAHQALQGLETNKMMKNQLIQEKQQQYNYISRSKVVVQNNGIQGQIIMNQNIAYMQDEMSVDQALRKINSNKQALINNEQL